MGSIISKIYDDYDSYKEICKLLSINPVSLTGSVYFHDHAKTEIKSLSQKKLKKLKQESMYLYNKFK